MEEVTVAEVTSTNHGTCVVLKQRNGERCVPVFIGVPEALAIVHGLRRTPVPRPMTHDLVISLIRSMGGKLAHVLLSELKDGVFYARLVVEAGDGVVEVDSRSSDAVALAIREDVPIYCDESVLEGASQTAEAPTEEYGTLWRSGEPGLDGVRLHDFLIVDPAWFDRRRTGL